MLHWAPKIVLNNEPTFYMKPSVKLSLITGMIVLSLITGAVFANHDSNATSPPPVFSDVYSNHPNVVAIEYLKEKEVIAGYPTGEFKPDYSINRAEFLTILVKTSLKSPIGKNCFKDVRNEWFAKYVCSAKRLGITKGYPDRTFKPGQNINLAEASAIISAALKIPSIRTPSSDPWFKRYVVALENKKAIPVTIDYMEKKLSRGEMAEIMWRLKTNPSEPTKTYASLVSEFPTIASCDELKEKFLAFSYSNRWRGEKGGGGGVFTPSFVSAPQEDAGDDYSKTNVQVEGVDEADVVKNDNKYIYTIRGKSVRVINAYPPDTMQEVAKLEFSEPKSSQDDAPSYYGGFTPSSLYVTDEHLVVLGNLYGEKNRVKVFVYDISEKASPKLSRSVEFDGYEISSRRIMDKIYLVLRQSAPYVEEKMSAEDFIPHYLDSKTGKDKALVACTSVRFYPQYREPNYLIVASISLNNPEQDPVKSSVYMGTGETVYSSPNYLYVAASRYEYDENTSYNVWFPEVQNTSTIVYQFALKDGAITYKDQGQVPGAILNQFSMDEYNDAFRIATTTGDVWNKENPSKNHIYILDSNDIKKTVGSVTGIAPGERIYSTRFIGKKGYMVTFKKVDPFFVIDLADPKNPKILGALKIPGFSDYLHPFDENHIIGFGKNTATPEEDELKERDIDFAWYQGIKIGLFDVTDPTNPKQKFTELIGDRGTDSELLYNHKALLFDKKRSLFGFPVTVYEIPNKEPSAYTGSLQGEFVFQGAYVYTLDLEKGFQLKGKITHQQDSEKLKQADFYSWLNNGDNVTRILSIGDFLYTLSHSMIKATGTTDMKEKTTLPLLGEGEYYSPYY